MIWIPIIVVVLGVVTLAIGWWAYDRSSDQLLERVRKELGMDVDGGESDAHA